MELEGFEKTRQEAAIIYIRVSTEEQVENYSLDTQQEICTKEAQKRNLRVDKVFREEGRSAKTITQRPVLIEMLEYCRKHKKDVDAVIVYRLDRVSRQTTDYLSIRKKLSEYDIKLLSATEPTGNSPAEKFVETMLAGFAQMDNDVRGERSRNGLRARFMKGLCSYVTHGYLNQNGYITKDPESFSQFREAWELLATGTKTLREIGDFLFERGVKQKKKGGKLLPQTLHRIFRNKFYTGKVVSKKYCMEVPGQHPPMITEELFYTVQAILEGRNTNLKPSLTKRSRDNAEFPLRRLVKCSACGSSYSGAWSKGKRSKYAYYFCAKRCKECGSVGVEDLQAETYKKLESINFTERAVKFLISWLRQKYYQRIDELQKRREEADDELKELYELRQSLIQKNLKGIYSDEIFKEQNKLLEDKIKLIQYAKNDELLEKYNLERITKFIEAKLSNVAETFANSHLKQVRVLLCSIFPAGMPYGRNGFVNTPLSPFYQAILAAPDTSIPSGGEAGIRTLGPSFDRQLISSELHSTTLAPLQFCKELPEYYISVHQVKKAGFPAYRIGVPSGISILLSIFFPVQSVGTGISRSKRAVAAVSIVEINLPDRAELAN
jgi:site-specific DNA recombinase